MSPDAGYFPRGSSVLRRVHEERAVGLLYGQRALAIGAIMPLNFVGTWESTNARDTPFQRLTHTGKAFETIFFGSRAQADQVLAFVHRMHERVHGELPQDAGATPAGTRYDAFDPELMLWTVAVIADSAQAFYELFVGRLSDADREALWQDYVRFGELFGMPRSVAPSSYAAFRSYWNAQLASPAVHLTEDARRVGAEILFRIPVPARSQPAMRVHNLVMLAMLPPRVRELYGLSISPAQMAAFRSVVATLRVTRPVAPPILRRGWNTRTFDEVARTERRRRRRAPAAS